MKKIFKRYGTLIAVSEVHHSTRDHFAFIEFSNRRQAKHAIASRDQTYILGRRVKVSWADRPAVRTGRGRMYLASPDDDSSSEESDSRSRSRSRGRRRKRRKRSPSSSYSRSRSRSRSRRGGDEDISGKEDNAPLDMFGRVIKKPVATSAPAAPVVDLTTTPATVPKPVIPPPTAKPTPLANLLSRPVFPAPSKEKPKWGRPASHMTQSSVANPQAKPSMVPSAPAQAPKPAQAAKPAPAGPSFPPPSFPPPIYSG